MVGEEQGTFFHVAGCFVLLLSDRELSFQILEGRTPMRNDCLGASVQRVVEKIS